MARASGPSPSGEAAYLTYAALNACRGQRSLSEAERNELPAFAILDCSGVSPDVMASADKWLKLAAELGFAIAQIDYARMSPTVGKSGAELVRDPQELIQYRADSFRYLLSASNTGNVGAMWFLSEAYREGTLTNQDLVMAYAYKVAIRNSGRGTNYWNDQVPALERTLTTEQRARGQELASEILARCCSNR